MEKLFLGPAQQDADCWTGDLFLALLSFETRCAFFFTVTLMVMSKERVVLQASHKIASKILYNILMGILSQFTLLKLLC